MDDDESVDEIVGRPQWDSATEPRDRYWGEDEASGRPYNIRHPKKRAFLRAFAMTGNIRQACIAAKCDRSSYYEWQEKDEKFGFAVEQARAMATERLEEEARRRAFYGTRYIRRSYYKGELVGEDIEYKYSDTLLIFLLKGLAPEKYADRAKLDIKLDDAIRAEAERLAEQYGIDAEQIIAEAEATLKRAAQ